MSGLVRPSICVRFAGDGEADEPLVVHETILHQFQYFQRLLDGEFQEGQQREVRIERISRAVGLVVLQHELDIIDSLTKDNLLDAMIALDYLQFDTDKIFTPGSNQSLLWGIHRKVVVGGWLHDNQLATSLLDSFSRYAFVARLIHQHKDIRTALLPALRKKPDVISAQWRRCVRGEEADDPIKAAMSLVDSLVDGLSSGRIDVSRQEVAQFITAATGSTSLAAAHGSVFERDIFTPSATSSTHPFANDERRSARCGGINFKVAALPHPYTPHPSPGPPPNAMDDADAKVADVGGWHITFDSIDESATRESFARCFAPDASLEISIGADGNGTEAAAPAAHSGGGARRNAIRLHEAPTVMTEKTIHMGGEGSSGPSISHFGANLGEGSVGTHTNRPHISSESLVHGSALKDVIMIMTVRHFPMRALALHYLRLCVQEGRWDDVTLMAKSIHREVAVHMLSWLINALDHRLRLMLCWAAAVGDLPEESCDRIVSTLTTDLIEENLAETAAVLPIIPSLPSAVKTAFEDALKGAVDARDDECFQELYNALVKEAAERQRVEAERGQLRQEIDQEAASRQRLEAEVEQLRQEIDQLRRGAEWSRGEMEDQQQQQREGTPN
ncbi:unnamed protein product [Vitrella brassicaformis CCMP3155]|uniref:Uncharacterized protein n=2 Tax=Vitrella brassicaformis TaxID=1169539 RepID=A0A0G4GNQ7_VITBC|nr:unnamed protein product [Vitrella brassicaformis CCMP3155]|eukprot:CEM31909.1 unnamed protein product [Vitrella brassicaformis CCMP3155]